MINIKTKYDFKPNSIYCGNNLDILSDFPAECIDLIYIDPPFFSNKNYEIIFGDGYELEVYKDRWEGGIERYINWMKPIIQELYRVLKPTGSFYLHCDWHASHYLKIECDKIFNYKNFQNEIVWHYFMGGKSKKRYARKHDVILFYSKTNKYTFNLQYKKRILDFIPALKNPANIDLNKKVLTRYGFKDAPAKKTGKDKIGYYSVVGLDDVWDISGVFNLSNEHLGYPTQKPELLLDVIIQTSSNEGDIVLDAFCGCGTTIAVAKRLKRQWIGIDVSPIGCGVMAERINYSISNIIDMKYDMPELMEKNWYDLQCWGVERIGGIPNPKKTMDKGVDGWKYDKGKRHPIEVKKGTIGRPAIQKFESVIRRSGIDKGFIIGSEFSGYAIEEINRINNVGEIKIIHFTFKNLLESDPIKKGKRKDGLFKFFGK